MGIATRNTLWIVGVTNVVKFLSTSKGGFPKREITVRGYSGSIYGGSGYGLGCPSSEVDASCTFC